MLYCSVARPCTRNSPAPVSAAAASAGEYQTKIVPLPSACTLPSLAKEIVTLPPRLTSVAAPLSRFVTVDLITPAADDPAISVVVGREDESLIGGEVVYQLNWEDAVLRTKRLYGFFGPEPLGALSRDRPGHSEQRAIAASKPTNRRIRGTSMRGGSVSPVTRRGPRRP